MKGEIKFGKEILLIYYTYTPSRKGQTSDLILASTPYKSIISTELK